MRVRLYQIHDLDQSNDEATEQTFVSTAHNIDKNGTTKLSRLSLFTVHVMSVQSCCLWSRSIEYIKESSVSAYWGHGRWL